MARWLRWLTAAVCALSLGLAACGGSDDDDAGAAKQSDGKASGEPIVIGAAIAQSSFMAPFDEPPLAAAQFAIDDINAQGGVLGRPLKLAVADMKSEPSQGPEAALKVLEQDAQMVIVSCDFDIGGPAAVTATGKGKIAFSTCAGSPQFGPQGIGPLAYTMGAAGQTEGGIMAEWATEDKGWKTAYLLTDTDLEYYKNVAKGFAQRFPEVGGKIVASSNFKQKDPPAAVVNKVLAAQPQPDFVFLASNPLFSGQVLRRLRASGYDGPILGSNSWDGDYWKKGFPGLSDLYFLGYVSLYGDDPNAKANELVERYRTEEGKLPDNSNLVTGYSVIEAFARAVEAAGSLDGDKVAAELDKFSGEDLLVGPTTFTPDMHISRERPMHVMQIQDGKSSFLKTWTPKKAPDIEF
jgi:branched-chain amino acid transport system substrate-binding protein